MNYSDTINIGIGAALTLIGSFSNQILTKKAQNKALANSFKGEISALISIIDKRNYLSQLEKTIKKIESTNKPEPYYFHVSQEYFQVYKSNCDKIGVLKNPLPEKISQFYTYANAVIEDTLVLKQLQYDKLISSEHIRNLIEYYQEYYSVFKITYDLGEEIIKLIDEKYN